MIPESVLMVGLQSTVLLASAGLVTLAMRNGSAAVRHHVWTLSFALLLLLPFWPRTVAPVTVPLSSNVTRIVVTAESSQGEPFSVAKSLNYLWLAVCLGLLGRTALAQIRAGRVAARAAEWQGNCYLSDVINVPIVTGLAKPKILLPRLAVTWPEELLAAVLAHEQMHLQRRDLWWQVLSQIATAVYWPNPLVWVAAYRHYKECEQACDDGVLESGVAASDYAQHLVEIARGLKSRNQLEGGLAMAATTTLEHRLRAMLNPLTSHKPMGRGAVVLSAALSLVLLAPVAGLRLVAQSKDLSIRGVVFDPSGAAMPDARITLSFPYDPARREVTRTNASGEFEFPVLPAGNYSIRVDKPGFAVLEQSQLPVEEGKTSQFRFTMNMGATRESMQVSGNAAAAVPRSAATSSAAIRVGGNVQASKLINKVNPMYPADCKSEGIQGVVVLNAVISKEGTIISLTPANQFVDQRLRKAAMDAVRLWTYQPTLLNGNPVEIQTVIEVNFTLLP